MGTCMNEKLEGDEDVKMIEFMVGDTHYGIDINMVDSIINPTAVTKVPNLQDSIKGVTNYRDNVILVIDMTRLLGYTGNKKEVGTKNIVISTKEKIIALEVDRVLGITKIGNDCISQPLSTELWNISTPLLGIVSKKSGDMVLRLDIDTIIDRLNHTEDTELQEVGA